MKSIMFIECKSGSTVGQCSIGWVDVPTGGRFFSFGGKRLRKTKGSYKYNCTDVETDDRYWVAAPKKNGKDTQPGKVIQIDEDVRVEYWTSIRGAPELSKHTRFISK